jgi:hypothetical protein
MRLIVDSSMLHSNAARVTDDGGRGQLCAYSDQVGRKGTQAGTVSSRSAVEEAAAGSRGKLMICQV